MVVVKEDSPTRMHLRYPTICPESLVYVSLMACCFLHVSVTIPHNGNLANTRCPRTIDGNLAKQAMALLNLWVITQMGGMHIPHLLFGIPIGPIMMNYRQLGHEMPHRLQFIHTDRLLIHHIGLLMIG